MFSKTKVSADKSAGEIKSALTNFGATNFSLNTNKDKGQIGFNYLNNQVIILFTIPENPGKDATIAKKKKYEQATNTLWRQLLICVKAKLQSVATGIETFEQAFMAHIDYNGSTQNTSKAAQDAKNKKQSSKLAKAA